MQERKEREMEEGKRKEDWKSGRKKNGGDHNRYVELAFPKHYQ